MIDLPDGKTGQWKGIRGNNVNLRSNPNNEVNYTVAVLDAGDLVLTTGEGDDGWNRIRLVGPKLTTVRGLLKADDSAMERRQDRITITGGRHGLKIPNRNAKTDEGYDPFRCASEFGTIAKGDEIEVTGEFKDARGNTWYLVTPPSTSEVWVHRAYLETIEGGSLPSVRLEKGRLVMGEGSPSPTEEETEDAVPLVDIDDLEESVDPVVTMQEGEEAEEALRNEAPMDVTILDDVSLADAEEKWEEIRSAPQDESELQAMQLIYAAIADRDTTGEEGRERALRRMKQIDIQRDLQKGIDALRRIELRNEVDKDRIEAIREALLDRSDYTVIGRLRRSRIYDGGRLPLLFRLEDPASGRTIAYVKPMEGMPLRAGVGRIVGIVGTEVQDLTRRIKIVTPYRFEIDLTEERQTEE